MHAAAKLTIKTTVAMSPMLLPATPHAIVKIAQEQDRTEAKHQTVNVAYGALVVCARIGGGIGEIGRAIPAEGCGRGSFTVSAVSLRWFWVPGWGSDWPQKLQNLYEGSYCFPQFTQKEPGNESALAGECVRVPHVTQNFATEGSSQEHLEQNIVGHRGL
jgi:hypothetical protein